MSRKAKEKSYDSILKIMSRNISEVDLLKDEKEKNRYRTVVKNIRYFMGVRFIPFEALK